MYKDILFRGIRSDGGGWCYGYYFNHDGLNKMFIPNTGSYILISGSVGQFTGLNDKNGIKVFEGDKFEDQGESGYLLVEWNNEESRFQLNVYDFPMSYGEGSQEIFGSEIELVDENVIDMSCVSEFEVIGNIHESEVSNG